MGRTVRLAAVAGILVALGIASGAVGSPEPAAGPATAAPPVDAGDAPARQRVGVVEQVGAVLGGPGAERSVTLRYPGSDYVKVHLGRALLLPGDHLTVSDPAGEEVYRYDARLLDGLDAVLGRDGGWLTSVTGDTAVVTVYRAGPDPLGLRGELAGWGVTVDKVARGVLPAAEVPAPVPAGREESLCGRNDGRDAICYRSSHPTVYRNSKAVARLLINGVELCSAFRVGERNRLLTNYHCLRTAQEAQRTEVWFNYQCARCGGWKVFRPTKVHADRVLDSDPTLDYTLFTVDDFEAVGQFGFLELADRAARGGEEIYVPQHPRGLPARVALASDRDGGSQCAVADPAANGYDWYTDVTYYCDTDGGSSGSPVLSRASHQVIALHHFGGCPNSGVRMDLIHPRIASLI